MEYQIKSVALGGFDKQDVVRYIESSARTAAEERRELEGDKLALEKEARALREEAAALREENEKLRTRNNELETQLTDLVSQLSDAASQSDGLRSQLRMTDSEDLLGTIRSLEEENEKLRKETEALRPDANAYARFRERLGSIECEARERADSLESAATERVRETLSTFYSQYQELIHAVETTASHVTGELRKVEFNLSQLPRAMDQAGRELNALHERVNQEETASGSVAKPVPAPAAQTPQGGAQTAQQTTPQQSFARPVGQGFSFPVKTR